MLLYKLLANMFSATKAVHIYCFSDYNNKLLSFAVTFSVSIVCIIPSINHCVYFHFVIVCQFFEGGFSKLSLSLMLKLRQGKGTFEFTILVSAASSKISFDTNLSQCIL